jgi:hypothetical protein
MLVNAVVGGWKASRNGPPIHTALLFSIERMETTHKICPSCNAKLNKVRANPLTAPLVSELTDDPSAEALRAEAEETANEELQLQTDPPAEVHRSQAKAEGRES